MTQERVAEYQASLTTAVQLQVEQAKAELAETHNKRVETLKAELTRQNQTELELLRSQLNDQGKDRDAVRDYQYEAHKRLYAECEPLLFQLAELSEHAYYRIFSLARTARQGDLIPWLSSNQNYYKISTLYKLIAPLAIYRLMQQRLTFVDLSLDTRIASQYRLLKFLYLTFTDHYDFAKIKPAIVYTPDVNDWKARRPTSESQYWSQGLYLGVLDNTIDALIQPANDHPARIKTYGEFEGEFFNADSPISFAFDSFADMFDRFHPNNRPVLWRMLLAQKHLYVKLLTNQSQGSGEARHWNAVSMARPIGTLDWSKPNEATYEVAVAEPDRVARWYLHERLPDVFDNTFLNALPD